MTGDEVLDSRGIVDHTRAADGKNRPGSGRDRVSARRGIEDHAIDLGQSGERNRAFVCRTEGSDVVWSVGDSCGSPVRRRIPIAGRSGKAPGCAAGVRIKDEGKSKNEKDS